MKTKINRKILFITVLLIFFILIISIYYSKYVSRSLENITISTYKKSVYEDINKILRDSSISDVINLYQNNDGEVIYIDYDLKKVYELLNIVNNYFKKNREFILKVPFFSSLNNIFLSNKGPKINVNLSSIESVQSKINTKTTDLGINNYLLELYITIEIKGKLIYPLYSKEQSIIYDFLISSKVINGRVPSIYQKSIQTN